MYANTHTHTHTSGKTIKENLAALPGLPEGQKLIAPVSAPLKPSGHVINPKP